MSNVFTAALAAAVLTAHADSGAPPPTVPAVAWSPAPPARLSFRFDGIWRRSFPLQRDARVLFGEHLLGFVGDRAITTDGLSVYLLDMDRGTVLSRIAAPGAQAMHVREGDDDLLLVWRRPGEVEEADKTPCGLAAYEPRRGRMRWRQRACDFLDASLDRRLEAVAAGRRLIVLAALHTSSAEDAGAPTALRAVDRDTGRPAWRQPGPAGLGALAGGRDRLYLASRSAVLALDPATGRTLWQVGLPAPADPARALDADRPVVVTTAEPEGDLLAASGDSICRLDRTRGAIRWQRALAGAGAIVQVVRRDDALLVVAYRDWFVGSLVALDASSGAVRWAREVWQPAIIGDIPAGVLFTSLSSGGEQRLSVIDPRDGAALGQIDLGESSEGQPAIARRDGAVVARDRDALTRLEVRPGLDDPAAAPARLEGSVKLCHHGCAPRSGVRVRVAGAGGDARDVVDVVGDAQGRFTLPLRQGRIMTATVDRAVLESLQGSFDQQRPAGAGYKFTRCHEREVPRFLAERAGQTVRIEVWIDCQLIMPD